MSRYDAAKGTISVSALTVMDTSPVAVRARRRQGAPASEGGFRRVRGQAEQLGAPSTRDVGKTVIGARIALLSRANEPKTREEWLARVQKDWTLLEDAPPEIRRDREIVLAALAQDKAALAFAAPELANDRAFLLEAIAVRPSVLRVVGSSFLDDPSFLLEAVRTHELAVHGVYATRPERFRDRGFFLQLLKETPEAWRVLERGGEALAADVSLAVEAAKISPEAVQHFSPALKNDDRIAAALLEGGEFGALRHLDPQVLLREPTLSKVQDALASGAMFYGPLPDALVVHPLLLPSVLAQNRRLISSPHIAEAVAKDPALAAACLKTDPLLFRELPKNIQRELDRRHPELGRRARELERTLHELGLDHLAARATKFSTIEELIRNRTTPDKNDPRPLAVVVYTTEDWNKAFESNALDELVKGYRVVYREVSRDTEAIAALEASTSNRPADLLILGGHGTKKETQLGKTPLWPWAWEEASLDIGDEQQLLAARIRERVARDAHVILESCSTGEGREGADNMANMLARVFPQATIHAPSVPAGNTIELDERGLFVACHYGSDDSIEYRVPPSA